MKESVFPNAGELHRFAFLALSLSFAGLPLYVHAPDFYATYRSVPLAALGTVLLVLRLIDAFQDPLIGNILAFGASIRRGVLLAGSAIFVLGFWMVFHPPEERVILWFFLSILLCTTGFSALSIGMYTLAGIRRVSSHDRTRFMAWREGYGLIGLLIASVLPSFFLAHENPGRAFHLLACSLIPFAAVGLFLFFDWERRSSREELFTQPGGECSSFRNFLQTLRKTDNILLFAIYFLSNFASSIPAILIVFYVRDWLGLEPWLGLFLVSYFLSGALSMLFWPRLSRRVGKAEAWAASMLLATLTFIWASTLGPGSFYPFLAVCILSGLALGADLALPPSLIADRIEKDGQPEHASRYFGLQTFLAKSAFALATGISLPALSLAGYVPKVSLGSEASALPIAYALIPSVIKGATAVIAWFLIAKRGENRL